MKPNFELITELQTLNRRDFAVSDAAYLKPYDSAAIVDGEWLKLDTSYKLVRGSTEADALVFPVHTEKGRYDVQAVGKANVLYLGMYEAELNKLMVNGAGALAVGDKLVVQTVSAGAFTNKRGLGKSAAATGTKVVVVGHVSRITATGIRFVHFGNQLFDMP